MRTMSLVMGSMLALYGLVGCASEVEPPTGFDDPVRYVETPLLVDATQHVGTIGAVRDFRTEGLITSGFTFEQDDGPYGGEYTYTYLEVISQNRDERWAAMSMIHIEGSLDELVPGETLRFAASEIERTYPEMPELFIGVTGCSGPENGAWEDDIPAETVTVDVLPAVEGANPDARVLHFVAEFPDGGRVEGEVGVELR